MTLPQNLVYLVPAAIVAVAAACGGDEAQAPEGHTPVSYSLLVEGTAVSAPYTFVAGETALVQIKFFNAAQHDLDDVEAGHFGGLTFNPTSLATAARVTGHNFQFDVTGGTAGTGTLQVSFGHDNLADETTFPSAPVTVTAGGGGGQ
jgi:hypothetical protein